MLTLLGTIFVIPRDKIFLTAVETVVELVYQAPFSSWITELILDFFLLQCT